MGRVDPFFGYSLLVRVIVYGATPAFLIWQWLRLRRALHVFQLEGYKRARFLAWCAARGGTALFLRARPMKKLLVMTGRARRIITVAWILSATTVIGPAAGIHVTLGAPWDLLTWVAATLATFAGAPLLLVGADLLLEPIQRTINARYIKAARAKLARLAPTVVGVTGSFGKTSTKTAIAAAGGAPGLVLATPESFNTTLGICRTINERLDEAHRLFVVEMGAYARGDIRELCDLVRPQIGVLTSIGPAHLERFGTLDAIRATKYELIESLPPGGAAVMNTDDPEVRALADETRHVRVVRYGGDPEGRPDVTARSVTFTPTGMTVEVIAPGEAPAAVHLKLLGRHALGHVLASVAVAGALGRTLDEMKEGLEALEPVQHRLQLIEGAGGVTVIDDAYNSNPEGAAAALEVLRDLPGRRKVVVSPGMVELGPLQPDANERFGAQAAQFADVVIFVGETNRDALLRGANRAGSNARVATARDLDEATELLKEVLGPGDVVLFENDLPDQYDQ